MFERESQGWRAELKTHPRQLSKTTYFQDDEAMNYVLRRNSEKTRTHEIPEEIAELFENQLGCLTGGNAVHGLRWEYEKIGIVFFENIKREHCCIYILPTSEKTDWKTVDKLQMAEWGRAM